MKPHQILLLALVAWACGGTPAAPPDAVDGDQELIPGVSGPYLGQTPPGRTLRRFAPGIVPDWFHAEVTVSADGREVYWAERSGIKVTKRVENGWTSPALVSFSGGSSELRYDDVPVVSPDNLRLFFLSKRPIGYASPNEENIWYVQRTVTGWSEPIPLPQAVNAVPGIHWQVSVAASGALYYSGGDELHVTRLAGGAYGPPEPLETLNAFGRLTCPFIAPDESYLIFARLEPPEATLFVSFRNADGAWLPPQALGGFPAPTSFVSRDGQYLFANHNWISAEILEDLRPGS